MQVLSSQPLKVWHVNHSDIDGGAARAAHRIYRSLGSTNTDLKMRVLKKETDDPNVITGTPRKNGGAVRKYIERRIYRRRLKYFDPGRADKHFINWPDSGLAEELNASDADLIHLHWLGFDSLSVEEIARIKKPIVWTLHDMWAFCGAEHYTEEGRYKDGYRSDNRPTYELGPDLNRWVWERKCRAWTQPIQIVTPSRWLGDCVRQSALMKAWPVSIIPYPMDLSLWSPIDQTIARRMYQLPLDRRIILYGAVGGTRDPRKGADLFLEALKVLRGQNHNIEVVIFGQSRPVNEIDLGIPIHYMGVLRDDLSLKLLYSAADVMVIPSRQDNLPNTALESLACGTPVIAFDVGGLPDLVLHKQTGWLAKPFDYHDFAAGIQWAVEDQVRRQQLHKQSRAYAIESFAAGAIAQSYYNLYQTVVAYSARH